MKKIKKALAVVPMEMVSFNDAMTMLRWGLDLSVIDDILYIAKGETPKSLYFENIGLLKAEDVTVEYAIELNRKGYSVTFDDDLAIFIRE